MTIPAGPFARLNSASREVVCATAFPGVAV
jgi:hypothetical protein